MISRQLVGVFLVAVLAFGMIACTSPASDNSSHPSDHTINKGGTYHKAGLNDPMTNCVSCHGSDLKGGTAGVSCFSCHGQKW
jgi:mono/diheme cytochrome c family protein